MGLDFLGSGLNLLEHSKRVGLNQDVGTMSSVTVASAGSIKLLRFSQGEQKSKSPLLIVPSLINRFYILDLMPEKSFINYLSEHFSVYLIDWGEPQAQNKSLSLEMLLDLHMDILFSALLQDSKAEQAHVLGHCLGGNVSLLWSLIHPEKVASLSLITTPIDFNAEGKLKTWAQSEFFDLSAFQEAYGNAPWIFLQASFHSMRPLQLLQKLRRVIPQASNKTAMKRFLALETWSSDSRDLPGACYVELIQSFFRENCLLEKGFCFKGQRYLLKDLRVPVSAISAEDDHIVPFAGTLRSEQVPFVSHFSHWVTRGGHIGGLLGKASQENTWPSLLQWLQQRDGENVRHHAVL